MNPIMSVVPMVIFLILVILAVVAMNVTGKTPKGVL
jgi:hypothetical protein